MHDHEGIPDSIASRCNSVAIPRRHSVYIDRITYYRTLCGFSTPSLGILSQSGRITSRVVTGLSSVYRQGGDETLHLLRRPPTWIILNVLLTIRFAVSINSTNLSRAREHISRMVYSILPSPGIKYEIYERHTCLTIFHAVSSGDEPYSTTKNTSSKSDTVVVSKSVTPHAGSDTTTRKHLLIVLRHNSPTLLASNV